MERLDRIEM